MSDLNRPYITEDHFFLICIHLVSLFIALFNLEVSYESLIWPPSVFCSPGQIISIPVAWNHVTQEPEGFPLFSSSQPDSIVLYFNI